ncbi:MAG: CHAT domain-containing protein [Bacteroidales bacterium]|nr:CHAT domain-containing protein [Bacteroidales bacterium]
MSAHILNIIRQAFLHFSVFVIPLTCYTSLFAQSDFKSPFNNIEHLIQEKNFDSAIKQLNSFQEYSITEEKYLEFTKSQLLLCKVFYELNNPDSVFYFLNKAKTTIQNWRITNDLFNFELDFYLGWIYYRNQQYDSSAYYFNRAIKLTQKGLDDSLKVLSRRMLGNVHLMSGSLNEAFKDYHEALLSELNREKPSDITLSSLYQNIGIVFANQLVEDSASKYFKKSIDLKEKILAANDPKLARGFLNFGRFLMQKGNIDESIKYLNKAEAILLEVYGPNTYDIASIYFNKGSLLILFENYDQALIYHERALDIYSKIIGPESKILAALYVNFGLIYNKLGIYDESIYYLEKVNESLIGPEQKVKIYRFLGSNYENLNDIEKAKLNYLKAINISERELGPTHYQTALAYQSYGVFCQNHTMIELSLTYFFKALKIDTALFGTDNREISNVLSKIGQSYRILRNYQSSLEYNQKAIGAIINDFSNTSIYQNPTETQLKVDINLLAALSQKATSFYEYYKFETKRLDDLKFSMNTVELCIKLFEKIRTSYSYNDDNTKLLAAEKVRPVFDLAVKASTELYQITNEDTYLQKSFLYTEKNKATVLLSSVRKSEALEIGNIPEEMKQHERKLREEITQYHNLIQEENYKTDPDSLRIARWKRKLFENEMLYDSLISLLELEYEDYYKLKYNDKVVGLSDLSSRLTANEAFIEYKLIDTLIYAYVAMHDSCYLTVNTLQEGFEDKIKDLTLQMSSFPEIENANKGFERFTNRSFDVFQDLLWFYPDIADKERLIVVQDGILGYLSFEALISELPEEGVVNYRGLSYLLKKHRFTYGYSGTLLFERKTGVYTNTRLMAFAPDYSIESETKSWVDDLNRDFSEILTPLKYSRTEVESIHEKYDGSLFIGSDATESQFKEYGERYSLLHFAMHTLINNDDPMASKMVFSLQSDDTLNDGLLNVFEIYNLKLNAQLAVLSACNTGIGKLSKSEGIMSLARAFMFAGVPGIVMSLWSIEDASSAQIMTSFYDYLKQDMARDEALREAKLTYLNNANQLQSHPYFWSAFVQIGENAPITRTNRIYYAIASAMILLLLSGLLYSIKRK